MSQRPLQFTQRELEKITELLINNSLSDVSRELGLNDLKLQYERKRNKELDDAIKEGIAMRSKNFKNEQAKKFKKRRELSLKEDEQNIMITSYSEEKEALEKYRKLVEERKERESFKELRDLEMI